MMDQRGLRVLHVEDEAGPAALVELMLDEATGVEIAYHQHAASKTEAVAAVTDDGPWDVVLLDMRLPDSEGFDTLESVLVHAPDSAVVMLTSESGVEVGLDALGHGASEFLAKSALTVDALTQSVRFAIERKAYEIELRRLGDTDALTGLANRRALEHYFVRCAATAERSDAAILVAVVDVDSFKSVNDAHGHAVGDECLRSVAAVLGDTVRASDLVARVGGDEFVVCAPGVPPSSIDVLAERLEAVSATPIPVQAATVRCSVGIAVGDGSNALDTLLAAADKQMYERKQTQKLQDHNG